MDICGPHRKHFLRYRFYCCVCVLRTLPRNGSTLLLDEYLLRACLPTRSLAMSQYKTLNTWKLFTYKPLEERQACNTSEIHSTLCREGAGGKIRYTQHPRGVSWVTLIGRNAFETLKLLSPFSSPLFYEAFNSTPPFVVSHWCRRRVPPSRALQDPKRRHPKNKSNHSMTF
jgi:hypothetical protein